MIVTIDLFPKEWLKPLYRAIKENDDRAKLLSEDHTSQNKLFCSIDLEITDLGHLIMLGNWIGHFQVVDVISTEALPKMKENIDNLIKKI
jgi:hypothetical protein